MAKRYIFILFLLLNGPNRTQCKSSNREMIKCIIVIKGLIDCIHGKIEIGRSFWKRKKFATWNTKAKDYSHTNLSALWSFTVERGWYDSIFATNWASKASFLLYFSVRLVGSILQAKYKINTDHPICPLESWKLMKYGLETI